MAWEDEALAAYERQRQAAANREDHIRLRSQIRHAQGPKRWIDLQGRVRGCIAKLNIKAGRTIVGVDGTPADRLVIRREDRASLTIQYDADLYRVKVSARGCEVGSQEMDLLVRPVDGNDMTVWVDRETGRDASDEEIAIALISGFAQIAPILA